MATNRKYESIEQFIDTIQDNDPVVSRYAMWLENYCMYRGIPQYSRFVNGAAVGIDFDIIEKTLNRKQRKERSTHNFLRGLVDLVGTKLIMGEPVPKFEPITSDDVDRKASRVANVGIQTWAIQEGYTDALNKWYQWAAITGTGILKMYWNDCMEGLPISLDGKISDGEIGVRSISPTSFFPDPHCESIETARYIIHSYLVPLDEIEKRFPQHKDQFLVDSEKAFTGTWNKFLDTFSRGNIYNSEDFVRVSEYWVRPVPYADEGHGKNKGCLIVRAGGKELYKGPNPMCELDDDENKVHSFFYPFISFKIKEIPESLFGDGMVRDMISPQRDIDMATNLMRAHIGKHYGVTYLVETTSGVDTDAFMAGKDFLQYRGIAPSYMSVPAFDPALLQWSRENDNVLSRLSNVGEMSQGRIMERGAAMSARAATHITDAENIMFSTLVKNFGDGIMKVGNLWYLLAKRYYTNERLAAPSGRYSIPDVEKFMGEDIVGNFKVTVTIGMGFGITATQRFENAISLRDRGIPIDDITMVRLSNIGGANDAYMENFNEAGAKFYRDLVRLINNEEVEVLEMHPHDAILYHAKTLIVQEYFEALNSEVKERIINYYNQHQQFIIAAQQQQMMMQQQQQQPAKGNIPPGMPGSQLQDTPTETQLQESVGGGIK